MGRAGPKSAALSALVGSPSAPLPRGTSDPLTALIGIRPGVGRGLPRRARRPGKRYPPALPQLVAIDGRTLEKKGIIPSELIEVEDAYKQPLSFLSK